MASTPSTTDDASTTKTSATARTTTLSILHFTSPEGCFNPTNIWYTRDDCSIKETRGGNGQWCSFFALEQPQTCDPGYLEAATRCPEYYTAVDTLDREHTAKGGGVTTSREILCCPTIYDFHYGEATLTDGRGSAAVLWDYNCIASSPSFSGRAPWTITVSEWIESSFSSSSELTYVLKTREFNPRTDTLIASPVTISFVIDADGKTCAPDCREWPRPTNEPPRDDYSGRDQILVAIIVPTVVGFLIIVGCVCCCVRNHRHKKRDKRLRAGLEPTPPAIQRKPMVYPVFLNAPQDQIGLTNKTTGDKA